jgi:DNA polymerase III epsilon subunit-like protein
MYLILDTETGGIGIDKSLLTSYFMVCDNNFQKVDDLYLFVKPDDGIYRVTGEAMGINKIDLVEHDKKAITYKKAGTALYQFLEKNFGYRKERMVPIGHGMSGDLDHIFDKLMSRATWETFVSYRRLDTSIVLQFLKSCGVFPDTVSGSLESLVEYFHIKRNGELHDAKVDAELTRDVLVKLVEVINGLNKSNI